MNKSFLVNAASEMSWFSNVSYSMNDLNHSEKYTFVIEGE